MNNNSTSSGTIKMLNKLRKSQEKQPQSMSRLDKYIDANKTIKQKAASDEVKKEHKVIKIADNLINAEIIHEIDPSNIIRWSGKDRPENELGDIKDLAESFKHVGQQVPCIVRPINDNSKKYELIVGERRWNAAKKIKIKLKVVVQNIDNHMAALIQAVENEKRNGLSEFAKGMSYANKIEIGMLSQKDLVDILGVSKQQVSRLLSFKKIPSPLFKAIKDFREVSARTAEELSRLSAKGNDYIDILISLAPKIRTGKFGGNRIIKEVNKKISPNNTKKTMKNKVFDKNGEHLFTWASNNKENLGLTISKGIISSLDKKKIDYAKIKKELQECIINKIDDLNK